MKAWDDEIIREKLNAAGDITREQFDQEGAWDKLQMRLEKPAMRQHTRKFYWAAAALLLIGLPYLAYQPGKVLKTGAPKTASTYRSAAVAPQIHSAPQTAASVIKPIQPIQHVIALARIKPHPLQTATEKPSEAEAVCADTIPKAADQVKTIAAAAKPVVIHINDLYEAPLPYSQPDRKPFIPIVSSRAGRNESGPPPGIRRAERIPEFEN